LHVALALFMSFNYTCWRWKIFVHSHFIIFDEYLAVSSSGSVLFPLEVVLQHKGSCKKGDFHLLFSLFNVIAKDNPFYHEK